jgi:hypothetical protein
MTGSPFGSPERRVPLTRGRLLFRTDDAQPERLREEEAALASGGVVANAASSR